MSPAELHDLRAVIAGAPDAAGVYFFLGADTELLYIGKAGSLRRRLWQHARARPGAGGRRLDLLYQRVREVRWQELPDEPAAEAREADLIAALRPAFNAGSAYAGRWQYLVVDPVDGGDPAHRFTLTKELPGGRGYGCFPHLGRGLASGPGIACSDGYPALLRLLWAASAEPGGRVPSRLTRTAPEAATVPVAAPLRRPLHAFLSGTSNRLLDPLVTAGGHRDSYLHSGLVRDRAAAEAFFVHGPRALRALRLRHRRPPGPVPREVTEELLAAEVHEAIGAFRLPAPLDPADRFLGRKAQPWGRA
jgi:hypothetical protein